MLNAEIEQVRQICKEEIKLAFGNATPLAEKEAKEAADLVKAIAKQAVEDAKEAAKEAKELLAEAKRNRK